MHKHTHTLTHTHTHTHTHAHTHARVTRNHTQIKILQFFEKIAKSNTRAIDATLVLKI